MRISKQRMKPLVPKLSSPNAADGPKPTYSLPVPDPQSSHKTQLPVSPKGVQPVSPTSAPAPAVATIMSPEHKSRAAAKFSPKRYVPAANAGPATLTIVTSERIHQLRGDADSFVSGEKVRVERDGRVQEVLLWCIEEGRGAGNTRPCALPATQSSTVLVMRDGLTQKKVSSWRPKVNGGLELLASAVLFVPSHAYHEGQSKRRQSAAVWTAWVPVGSSSISAASTTTGFLILFDAVERNVTHMIDMTKLVEGLASAAPPSQRHPSPQLRAASHFLSLQPILLAFSTYNHRVHALHQYGKGCSISSYSPHPPYHRYERFALPFPLNGSVSGEAVGVALDTASQQFLFVMTDKLHCLVVALPLSGSVDGMSIVRTFRPSDFTSVAQHHSEALFIAMEWLRAERDGHVILPEYFHDVIEAQRKAPSVTGGLVVQDRSDKPRPTESPMRRATPAADRKRVAVELKPSSIRPYHSGSQQPPAVDVVVKSAKNKSTVASVKFPKLTVVDEYDEEATVVSTSVSTAAHLAHQGRKPQHADPSSTAPPPWYVVHRSVSRPASTIADDPRSLNSIVPYSGHPSEDGSKIAPFRTRRIHGVGCFVDRAINALAKVRQGQQLAHYFRVWQDATRLCVPFCIDATPALLSDQQQVVEHVLVVPVELLLPADAFDAHGKRQHGVASAVNTLLAVCKVNRIAVWVTGSDGGSDDGGPDKQFLQMVRRLKEADGGRLVISEFISFPTSRNTMQDKVRKVLFRNVHAARLCLFNTSAHRHFCNIFQGRTSAPAKALYENIPAVAFCPTKGGGHDVAALPVLLAMTAFIQDCVMKQAHHAAATVLPLDASLLLRNSANRRGAQNVSSDTSTAPASPLWCHAFKPTASATSTLVPAKECHPDGSLSTVLSLRVLSTTA